MEGYAYRDTDMLDNEPEPRPSDKYQSDYEELRKAADSVPFSGMSEDQAKAARYYLRDKVNKFIEQHAKVEDYFNEDYKDKAEAAARRFRNFETLQRWKTLFQNPQEVSRIYSADILQQAGLSGPPPAQVAQSTVAQRPTPAESYVSMEQFLTQAPQEGIIAKSSQGYTAKWVKNEDGGWDLVTYSQDPALSRRALSALTSYFKTNFQEKMKDNQKIYELNRSTTPYMFNIGDDYFSVQDGKVTSGLSNTHVWNTKEAKEARATGMYYIFNDYLIYPDGTAIPNNNYDVNALNKNLSETMKIKREELKNAKNVERDYRNQWLKAWEEVLKSDQDEAKTMGADIRTNREKFALRAYLAYLRAKVEKTADEKKLLDMIDGTGGQVQYFPEFVRNANGSYKYGRRNAPIIVLRPTVNAPGARPVEYEAD
jgi:hypothetical protein